MNYIIDGNYYIIAKYRDIEKPEIISLNQKWYLDNGQDINSYRNDLAAIDLVTLKYKNIDEFKDFLIKNMVLKNKDVDLYIVHPHKYKGKTYLNEMNLIFNKRETRSKVALKIAKKRLEKQPIEQKDINDFYNRFFSKINSRLSFKAFFTMPFKPNNEYLSLEILKNEKSTYQLKYKSMLKEYTYLRNIISMWNLYDELNSKYENIDELTLGNILTKEYLEIFNLQNNRRIYDDEVLKLIDKNQVVGQITFDEYLKEKETKPKRKTVYERNQEELAQYKQNLINLQNAEREIKEEEFDSLKLRELSKKVNVYEIVSYLTTNDIKSLTPKDRLKLGMIGIIEYNQEMEKQNGKRRN